MILHIFWAQINSFWDNLSGQKSPPNEAQNISYPKSESPSPKLYIIMSLQGIFINNICDLSVLFSLLIFLSLHSVQLGPWLTWSKYQLKQFEESGILGLFCETTTTKFNWNLHLLYFSYLFPRGILSLVIHLQLHIDITQTCTGSFYSITWVSANN